MRSFNQILLLSAAIFMAAAQYSYSAEPGTSYSTYDFTDNGINYAIKYKRIDDGERRMTDTVVVRRGSEIPSDGSVIVPSEVEFDGRKYIVGEIDSYAFDGRVDLKSITIPASVTEIGANAFAGCSNLSEIHIPEGLQKIGIWAFRQCRKLSDVELPRSVRVISESAFDEAGLKQFKFYGGANSLTGWAMFGFDHSFDYIRLPESISKVSDLKAKVVDYYGNDLKIDYVIDNSDWKVLLLHTSEPFCPWPENADGYRMKQFKKFAGKCIVYVPDDAVDAFRADKEWKVFKAIKPLSEYKK